MDQSDIELYFKNNNLGIGVENPKNKLAIEGNIKANQYYLINGQLKNDNSKLILENNNDKISLYVQVNNTKAINFYQKNNFKIDKKIVDYYENLEVKDALYMVYDNST